MEKELIVQGMHCDACLNLIKMELAEAGLAENIKAIKLLSGQNKGSVTLTEIDDDQIAQAVNLINALDQYRVED